eukprot:NODE_3374_length_795_cov_37.848649.p2 GENE.NODE_3374_length_795_cov_37.848649~~NODE_3374_length_795_cov_37.848649.p2  ORF type:complete len:152 (-),score=44.63 NODE_3374_length_795_cov_37.848649:338-769(-)
MGKEYSLSPFVDSVRGGLLCFGDGEMNRPVALVQVATFKLVAWAESAGVPHGSIEELCASPGAEQVVLASLNSFGKAARLATHETLFGVRLISGEGPSEGEPTASSPWTPENTCFTASNKVSRARIQQVCAELLDPLRAAASA